MNLGLFLKDYCPMIHRQHCYSALAIPLTFPMLVCLLLMGLDMYNPSMLDAQGLETISVAGKIVNGTAGGDVPTGADIALHAIDGDAGGVATYNATSDEQGNFLFEGVVPLAGGNYVLVMDYAGMRYNALIDGEESGKPAEFTVYEVTRDISVIEVERQAMIIADIDPKEREIRILEVLTINNSSDETLLPELTNITNPADINFLRFSLPPEASELNVQSTLPGGDVIPMGTGFAVTAPVLPGEHQVTYTYSFPYQGDEAFFNQRLIQGAKLYQVLAPVSLSQIQVAPLEPKPRIEVDGAAFLVWEGTDFEARQGVVLQISQLPEPGLAIRVAQTISGVDLWLTVIPVTLGLGLGALLLFAWFRGVREARSELVSGLPEQRRRQSLVQAVAVLDERFERGQVGDQDYRERRNEMLGRLRQETPGVGGQAGPGANTAGDAGTGDTGR